MWPPLGSDPHFGVAQRLADRAERIRPGRLEVAIAAFSVMPYDSNTGTPMPMKNLNISGAIGAAPETAAHVTEKLRTPGQSERRDTSR